MMGRKHRCADPPTGRSSCQRKQQNWTNAAAQLAHGDTPSMCAGDVIALRAVQTGRHSNGRQVNYQLPIHLTTGCRAGRCSSTGRAGMGSGGVKWWVQLERISLADIWHGSLCLQAVSLRPCAASLQQGMHPTHAVDAPCQPSPAAASTPATHWHLGTKHTARNLTDRSTIPLRSEPHKAAQRVQAARIALPLHKCQLPAASLAGGSQCLYAPQHVILLAPLIGEGAIELVLAHGPAATEPPKGAQGCGKQHCRRPGMALADHSSARSMRSSARSSSSSSSSSSRQQWCRWQQALLSASQATGGRKEGRPCMPAVRKQVTSQEAWSSMPDACQQPHYRPWHLQRIEFRKLPCGWESARQIEV